MKAALCKAYGPPESLLIENIPEPDCGPEEVIVRVSACALNFADTLIIQNKYQFKPDLPFSPGGEIAGIVEETGSRVSTLQTGDRVMGYVCWGGAQELVKVKPEQLIKVPDNVPLEIAAGLSVTYGTTLHAFRDRANLKSGESVAVLGASGGVGQAAVEIALLMGAEVIACASSNEKLRFAKQLGARHLLDYSASPLKEALKSLTNGDGVDIVYDAVGGDFAEQAVRAMAWQGRYLVVGFASGDIPKIPLNLLLLKGCDLRGVFWGRAAERDPEGHKQNMELLLQWVQEGKLKPHIHGSYPLEEISAALNEIASRKANGKVVISF